MNATAPAETRPISTDELRELSAIFFERLGSYTDNRKRDRESTIRLGEALWNMRVRLSRTAYGQLIGQHMHLKTAQRVVNKYLQSVGKLPNKTERDSKQNTTLSGQECPLNGTGNPACQNAAQPLSQDDLEDLLGCTPVSTFVTCDEPEAGEGEGQCEGGFEDEFEDERLGGESEEFEISNLKFESGDTALESGATQSPLRLADSAPPPPGAGEAKVKVIGPQLTLASLYEQAQSVGSEFMRVIESGLDEAVKARLVADVRGLVAAAMKQNTALESGATEDEGGV